MLMCKIWFIIYASSMAISDPQVFFSRLV